MEQDRTVAGLFRASTPRGLARSLSDRHLAVACRLSSRARALFLDISILTPSLAFWSLLALSMAVLAMATVAGRSSLPPPLFRAPRS